MFALTLKRLLLAVVLLPLVLLAGFALIHYAPDKSVEELSARWAQPPSTFVDIDGMSVHIRDEGPRDSGPPIVLLHGMSSSLHTWDGWAETLTENYRVIRFDLPGFGLTGAHIDNDYSIESYSRFVIAVLDKLKLEQVVLGGNSLGGHIAWATTVMNPDRVVNLVLVDSAGYPLEPESVPVGFRIAATPVLRRLMQNVLPRFMVRSSLENVYGDPSLVTEEQVDRYYELTTREGNRAALAERMRQFEAADFSERIPDIRVRTLILWGLRDKLIPPENAYRFFEDIPYNQLVTWPDLGHIPHEEAPERTVEVLIEFLVPKTIPTD